MEGLYPHPRRPPCSAMNSAGVFEKVGSDVTM